MKLLTRNRAQCPSCGQLVVPETPSKVVAIRVAMTACTLLAGVVEYRRAVKRETEQARLEQLHDTDVDGPLDAHLERTVPEQPPADYILDEEPRAADDAAD